MRLFGVFRNASGTESVQITLPSAECTVRHLVAGLIRTVGSKELEDLLVDPEFGDPRPNAVILVSGREIGTLRGLDTSLASGDEIALLPVAHGGRG